MCMFGISEPLSLTKKLTIPNVESVPMRQHFLMIVSSLGHLHADNIQVIIDTLENLNF